MLDDDALGSPDFVDENLVEEGSEGGQLVLGEKATLLR